MNYPKDTNPETWHRFFAAYANNVAWTLAESPAGQFDPRELLDAAHAAAWHWRHVGNELNRMRALKLLALAHARTGLGTTALAFADEVRDYFLSRAETPDWEIAITHAIHAYSAFAAGAQEKYASSYAESVRACAAVARDEDRNVVERVLKQVPGPGNR